jgi:glycerol uptake facilitator-like aquaporin
MNSNKVIYPIASILFLQLSCLYFLWFQAFYKVIAAPVSTNYITSHNTYGYSTLNFIVAVFPLTAMLLLVVYMPIKIFQIYKNGMQLKKSDLFIIGLLTVSILNFFVGNGLTTLNPFEAFNWFKD